MKVLHIQKASGIGGSERHLLSLLPALAAKGVEVRMCVLTEGRYEDFVSPLKDCGVGVSIVGAGGDLQPSLIPKLRREVRSFGPRLVHTHLIHADFYGQAAARMAGIPGISTLHSTVGFYRRQPYLSAARVAGRLARRTIAISQHVERFASELRLAPPDRVRVVRYGIKGDGWVLPSDEIRRSRSELGIERGQVVVGVASRLVPYKGHDLLLDAIQAAGQKAPSLRLLVAGDGPLRKRLEQRSQALPPGTVRFLGFVADIRRFINSCDIFAFPSQPGFGEGFGLAALEALAAGRPVVASNLDSLPEVVKDRQCGFLVPPGDPLAMADKLVELALNEKLRRRMEQMARQRALTSFSLEEMVDKTVSVYAEIDE